VLLGPGRGLRLEIDFETQSMHFLGLYEAELNRHLIAMCRGVKVAFDVGASIGYESLVLARLAEKVVAFEPDNVNAAALERNTARNPREAARIELHREAMGEEGPTTISVDGFVASTGEPPGFIKIDVEGSEAAVLHGAERTLARYRPGLVVEVHSASLEEECRGILENLGYRTLSVDRRRILREKRPMALNRWLVARP
jgi:hypothetical protein